MLKVALLNSDTIAYKDKDVSALAKALLNPGIVEGCAITKEGTNVRVAKGLLFIECKRLEDSFLLPIFIEEDIVVAIENNKKLYIKIPQENINNPTLNIDQYSIASIIWGDAFPTENFTKLCSSNSSGDILTETVFAKIRNESVDLSNRSLSDLKDGPKNTPTDGQFLRWDEESGYFEPGGVSIADLPSAEPNLSLSDYIAGSDLKKNDSVFIENLIGFSDINGKVSIGKTNTEKRIEIKRILSGTANNKIKLGVSIDGTPSYPLKVRVESDSNGKPSGTLFAQGTEGQVLSAGLSTTPTDKEVTLASNISGQKGTVVWVVLYIGEYGNETVNNTNYYSVSCDTTTPTDIGYMIYNGVDHYPAKTIGEPFTQNIGLGNLTTSSSGSQYDSSYTITPKRNCYINEVTAVYNVGTFTLSEGSNIIVTAKNNGNKAVFTGNKTNLLLAGHTYTLYHSYYGGVTNQTESSNSNDPNITLTCNNGRNMKNPLTSITTIQASGYDVYNNNIYLQSTTFEQKFLSKTNPNYSKKTCTEVPRIITKDCLTGGIATYTFFGVVDRDGEYPVGSFIYLDEEGKVTTAPGQNAYTIGYGLGKGFYIDKYIKKYIPSDFVIVGPGGMKDISGDITNKKRFSVKAPYSGTIRVKFTLSASGGSYQGGSSGRIYKNGVGHGTARSFVSYSGSQEYTEDLVFSKGDTIELWGQYSGSSGYSGSVGGLKLCYSMQDIVVSNEAITAY